MAKSNRDYFGLGRIVSIIIAILIPLTWICGLIIRLQEGKIVAFIVRIFLGWNIVWLLDLIFIIKDKKICRLLNK